MQNVKGKSEGGKAGMMQANLGRLMVKGKSKGGNRGVS